MATVPVFEHWHHTQTPCSLHSSWGEKFLVSHIQFHIQTGWLGVPSEADGERCWIDMCRWCDLWHRVVVPTLIRHQMLARYLVYDLGGPFLSQRTQHNSGITHHPPFHSPLYRLALVVLLNSPSTQKKTKCLFHWVAKITVEQVNSISFHTFFNRNHKCCFAAVLIVWIFGWN